MERKIEKKEEKKINILPHLEHKIMIQVSEIF